MTTVLVRRERYPWVGPNIIMCWDHGYEWVTDDTYQICSECFHVFPTAQSLLDMHNEVLRQMGDPPRSELGNLAHFCANCVHDF